ncbi:50S ribosomal protein L13 [Candidatus Woesebacteria bacterium RIFOXYA1_FULL_43_9]|uniref:Large ribosomal subunit protein uL13 n=1 Tax=Candidatus Woesebacteria bacterium RIFOXYA1_FULL_43_9 TaxID=1802534 RepID=A0A1F8CLN9_9BACT|nr:MAG: 50S ribosomal protein L13 [Candidatus Woesebacteria bacterium RIFOXYA1_FULL_43_9]
MQKTYQPKSKDVIRNWHLIDAKGQVVGRLATRVATLLMGKHKPEYTTHMDMGDYVVLVNAKEVVLTGNKVAQKKYIRHSGYPGGFKSESVAYMLEKHPERVITHAVDGMLPDNRLKDKRLARLKVFVDSNHTYSDKLKK